MARDKKDALEYTNDDQVTSYHGTRYSISYLMQVCAGPCLEQDSDLVCSYVDWEWSEVSLYRCCKVCISD